MKKQGRGEIQITKPGVDESCSPGKMRFIVSSAYPLF